jgi:hypothetical protein
LALVHHPRVFRGWAALFSKKPLHNL